MEFKRVLFLKKQMVQKMGKQAVPITEQYAFSMDALTLAYMGDVVWSLFIRDALIHTGIYQVQILSTLTSEIVSARWQSRILFEIREVLNDRELKVCKRGRNTSSTVPKSATVEEYREATAFEALLGYLKLAGEEERLRFILQKSLKYVAGEFQHAD